MDQIIDLPFPANEPIRSYAPGTPERDSLHEAFKDVRSVEIEIPLIIGGKEVRTVKTAKCLIPHEHGTVLATYHQAGAKEVAEAAEAAVAARRDWIRMPWQERLAIFLKAADMLAGPRRDLINATTMLNMSKTCFQAEIDAACELIDFLRFNAHFATRIYNEQPASSAGMWNRLDYRPLEGFVFAVTPFNFTSIAGNLPTAPAMMGNVSIWKPASSAVLPAWHFMRLLIDAGLPDGVINFLPGRGSQVGGPVLESEHFAGLHFTGSTAVFQSMWQTTAKRIASYRSYPRIVGETGGKDFIVAHPSADPTALVTAMVRGAFEFQGQKCSAASRAYIPQSLWAQIKDELVAQVESIRIGSPVDFSNFMTAVIDEAAFKKIAGYIDGVKAAPETEVVVGGTYDSSDGWFIDPTVVETTDPRSKTMVEEIFGPVLTVYAYPDDQFEETLALCDTTSPYALTGAVFANDRAAVVQASEALRHAAGNFYVNDKPTGAVVGQQPFGGGRASGTNDKAGSLWNLMRWVSPRNIKETFVPATEYTYPFMG